MSNGVSETGLNFIPAGYKQTEVGVIPEDWEVVEFGSALKEFRNGYAFSASGYASTGTPIITMAQIGLSGSFQFDISKVNKWDSEQQDSLKEFWVRDGDLLIAMTDVTPDKNLIGQMAIAKLDGIALLNQRVGLLRLKNEIAYSGYFSFLSCLPVWKTYCKGVASLGVQANIGTSDIRKAKVPLPTVKEQTAIANALSDVDALISELEKLIAKKQAIKTATMQQLLTGRTRLPQFALREDGSKKSTKKSELGEIPEDWEVVNIGDLGQVDPENLGSTTSPDYEFNYVSLEQIEKGVLVGTTRTIFRNAPSRARRVLKKGDILVSTVRPNLMSHYFVQHEVNDLICSTGFSVIRFFEEKLCPGYLYQHLFSSVINNQIEMLISGSNYPAINSGDVKQLKVQIGSVEEQTAIATILSDMDKEIQALKQRLSKTYQIKQGMMQELLTGKTRLIKPSKEVIHE
ncbi:restriction endonuclease subunit S [Providencia sp. M-8]|uniref:restriction endonuclease subunit S n=1 Tax=Providencia sp. M-8 TaxID=2713151 RepID=UPI00140D0D31